MRIKLARQMVAIVIVAIGAIVTLMLLTFALSRKQLADKPQIPVPEVSVSPVEVRVKAVERKVEQLEQGVVVAVTSDVVATVCGAYEATADLYEVRNDALRSIMRSRSLTKDDAAALLAYLASTNDAMRVERVAALKNDVMNLLRRQETPVEGFAETLIGMFDGGAHPPAVLDYCVQHLGAMQGEITDDATRRRIREVLVGAARRAGQSYAGTALYSLADDRRATPAQESELKRLTLALCRPEANSAARIAAIQLAGESGYAEALPILRETLSGERRDAVLDIVAIGSVGLLGDIGDIALLSRFSSDSRRATAADVAVKRITERNSIQKVQR